MRQLVVTHGSASVCQKLDAGSPSLDSPADGFFRPAPVGVTSEILGNRPGFKGRPRIFLPSPDPQLLREMRPRPCGIQPKADIRFAPVETTGIEPATSWLQTTRSPS